MKNVCFTYYRVITKSSKKDSGLGYDILRKTTFYKNNKKTISTFFNESLTKKIEQTKESNHLNSIDKKENFDFFAYKKIV